VGLRERRGDAFDARKQPAIGTELVGRQQPAPRCLDAEQLALGQPVTHP
jgi:hypothetical protein